MEASQEKQTDKLSSLDSMHIESDVPFWVKLVERCEKEVEDELTAELAEENIKRQYDSDPLAEIRKEIYNSN